MIRTPLLSIAVLLGSIGTSGALAAQSNCTVDKIRSITPSDAVIDAVKPIAGPVAHCEVTGHIITTDPGPNRVEFGVMLPDSNFNGRYYFIGEGAAAGFVPTTTGEGPLASYYVGTTWKLLSEGFTVAGSDTGHKGLMWDFGVDNPAARLDHGHRGAHVSAVATQAITRAYYAMNQQKLYRYHLGCSGGGRMGAMAVYNHPEDYDGAVVSTGFGGGGSTFFPWILQYVIQHPDSWISPPKLAFLERKVAEKCAGPDGLVRDPNACGFKPSTLQCKGADNDECLTAAQIKLVERVTGPYKIGPDKTSGGFTMTNPTGWSAFLIGASKPTNIDPNNPWALPGAQPPSDPSMLMRGGPGMPPSSYGIAQSMFRGFYFRDAKFDLLKMNFDDKATMQTLYDRYADLGVIDTDISAFKKAGGKLILWAGIDENAVPPNTEIEYFNALKTAVPGRDDFVRLYLAPGVMHCGGGKGPQDTSERLLDKVIAWVEEGKRPDEVVASASVPMPTPGAPAGMAPPPVPSRTVLLCPFPQTAVFKGKKDAFAYDATNWKCE
ncbi:MAG: hypothetical protein JWM78_2933 [Verrucomicrobiaceae bacterium]|nr:hypothetical protein [Verrucomicrobiaceae bacterium]